MVGGGGGGVIFGGGGGDYLKGAITGSFMVNSCCCRIKLKNIEKSLNEKEKEKKYFREGG